MRLLSTIPLSFLLFFYLTQTASAACRYSKHDVNSIVRCAEADDDNAQKELGDRYFHGIGVAQSTAEAIRWYQKSAEAGFTPAQYTLGYIYQRGLGIRKSDATAMNWYHHAAQNGSLEAQYNLATLLLLSTEIQKNPTQAFQLYQQAAEKGEIDSTNNLGYLYETGSGTAKNLELAEQFYRKAAMNNQITAQYNLGRLLFLNRPEASLEAKLWLERAAKQGYAPAMSLLGQAYYQSSQPDYAQAYYWFSLAAAFGHPGGKTGQQITAQQLTPETIAQTHEQIKRFSLPGKRKSSRRGR